AAGPARDPRPDRRRDPVLQAIPLDQAVRDQRRAAARARAAAVARGARAPERPLRVHPVRVLLDFVPVVLVEPGQVRRPGGPAAGLPLHRRHARPGHRRAPRQPERSVSPLPLPHHHELRRRLPEKSQPDEKSLEFPVLAGSTGPDVVDIRPLYAKSGMFTYDPGFMSTASCTSAITYIDGDAGILLYRGYPIEQLAQHCDFLEVCYLLLNGELPNRKQKNEFVGIVTHHTMVHEQLARLYQGFRRDAHPMAVMVGVVGAL